MNILINRTDAIGDLILTIPMAIELKKYFPQCRVVFLVSPVTKDILRHNPYVDEILVYNKNWPFYKKAMFAFNIFKNGQFKYYFYVGGPHFFSFMAFMFWVPFRGGLLSRWPSFLFLNKGVRQKRSTVEMHESEYNLNLLMPLNQFLASDTSENKLQIKAQDLEGMNHLLYLGSDERESVKRDFFENYTQYLDRKIIMIHPGMTGHTLNWPPNYYAQFAQELNDLNPGKFLFIVSYTPNDDRFIRPFKFEMEDYNNEIALIYYDGSKKGLRYSMNLISWADLFVGPSTGPTHIANALKIKTFSIFSPIKVQSALRWSPFFKNNLEMFVPEVVCGESHHCAKELCPYYECMSKIETDDLAEIANKYLTQNYKAEDFKGYLL